MGRRFIILLFIILGLILYANTFQNQMFWDDDDFILKNQYVQNWQYFPKFFSENLIAGSGLLSNYYRPILLFIFSLEWHLWGNWVPGYHFVNTSFHIVDAVLLFFILSYILKKRALGVATALIFLVHPLQTEAVTYVSGLGDSLSVFFMFLGILFYLKSKNFLSLSMYVLALMSKETAIIMPALIFISDFFLLHQSGQISFTNKLKKIVKTIWPFLVIAGFYILLRATILNFNNTFNLYNEENTFTSNFHVRLFTFFRILLVYLQLLFFPFGLHMERSIEIAASFNSFSVIFGAFIFLGLLTLAFTTFKRYPIVSFGILWFFIGLAPTSNLLVPINGLLYEHWLYLPLIGIFLILFWLGTLIGKKYNLQIILIGIFIIFLNFLSAVTINRNKEWRDPITFYNQTLKYAPGSYRVINNLGMAYDDKGDYEKVEKTYQKAIALNSKNPVAYHNLGNMYKKTGKIDLAVKNFKTAIKLNPKFTFSYNALLNIYLEKKNYKEARKIMESYLGFSDSKINTLFLLAQIASEENDFNGALSYLEKAFTIDPTNQSIQISIANIKNVIESKEK